MSSHRADRVISGVAGGFMLAAAMLKIVSPEQIVAAIAFALGPLMPVNMLGGVTLALALIVGEVALGLTLLLMPSSGVRLAGALVFLTFAAVLVTRFTSISAPPCGCLGRLIQSSHTQQAWLDAGRNVAFAGALLATIRRTRHHNRPSPARPHSAVGGRPGVTLVETLVVIAIIAILLAITLTALRWARAASAVTRSLSAQQQIVAAVHMYGQSSADFFPHFQPLDGTAGPVRMRGYTVHTGYFRAHMGFWIAAVGPDDDALINLAMWPPRSRREPLSDDDLARGLHYSVYFLTATIAADPAAFTEPIASGPSLDPALLRGVRWSEMSFPSRKGLFLDFALIQGEPDDRYAVGFGDGSAAQLPGPQPPEPVVPQPASGPQTIVISTRNGIRGVDR